MIFTLIIFHQKNSTIHKIRIHLDTVKYPNGYEEQSLSQTFTTNFQGKIGWK